MRGAGAFLNPVLMYCDKPIAAGAVHDVEAFGPVSTVMPYDGIEKAVALAAKGKGSLVSSVFTDEPKVAEAAVLGLAPHHGRVLIDNRATAKSSTGHGSPLAPLVQGGPGGAGGGEEMGGMRGVKHYMQRTAVQHGVHPFRKSLAELTIGDQLVTAARQVTLVDVEHFAHFTGDTLQVRLTCKEINPRANAEHGEVRWDCQVTKQTGAVVAQHDVLTMVAKVWPSVAQAAE